ncbi:ferric iron reductase [Paenibacillus dendritiformis]|uniref:Ferric iron reductase n=1 Tax=Paenibacillus dendritiformis C454 TaxID=1131935 RepID=H3SNT1_9BACL|nr:ferric iron reductase [Paenibacillus dendritiformis]EHQ59271.1 ferric iron reductase [Paenibacillus dendritiformis C454]CAH8773170.1 ferric iron reductase [Paenibacillus dendritiformis]
MFREQQPCWEDMFRIRAPLDRERAAKSERVALSKEELLTEAGIRRLLREAKRLYRCADEKVAASLLMKRYAHPLAGGGMHAFSRLGQLLDPDKWSFTLILDASGDIHVLGEPELEPCWGEPRSLARERQIELLFKGHFNRLFQLMNQVSGISIKVLWANVANVLEYYYDLWATEAHTTAQELLLQEDRDGVLHEAAGALYGQYEANPLAFTYTVIPHPAQDGNMLRIREVCCLKFRSEQGLHCTTCPHITERQRADICKLYQ